MNKQDLTIGCLSLSAVILLVGVFVVGAFETRPVVASGMIDAGGPYKLLVGRLNDSSELVYLIDGSSNRLAVYKFNETSRRLQRAQVLNLDEAPDKDAKQQQRRQLKP